MAAEPITWVRLTDTWVRADTITSVAPQYVAADDYRLKVRSTAFGIAKEHSKHASSAEAWAAADALVAQLAGVDRPPYGNWAPPQPPGDAGA